MMPAWRRNLYVLFFVQLLSTAGFSLVFPFLPLYVKEIGIATRGSIEFWVGLVFSSQAVTMMIASPIWGGLADRYGRKLMLVRATVGGAILIGLMGFVQNVEQLVILRTVQGTITGVVAAASALVAASAPRERSGEALGMMQMARSTGVAVGPIIGGVLGDAFGFRESFWITGIMLGISGICTMVWVHEDFTPPERAKRPGLLSGYKKLLKAPGMNGLYELSFLRSLGQSMIGPIAALFVVELMGTETGAASVTGIVMGGAAFTAAISSVYLGNLGDRVGHGRVLIASAAASVVLFLPQPFVTTTWQLVVLQALSGFAVGGMIPSVAALMNLWAPSGNQGATYGLDTSVNAAARSISPMLAAGVAYWIGLRGVFGMTALVYAAVMLTAIHVLNAANRQERSVPSRPSLAKGGD